VNAFEALFQVAASKVRDLVLFVLAVVAHVVLARVFLCGLLLVTTDRQTAPRRTWWTSRPARRTPSAAGARVSTVPPDRMPEPEQPKAHGPAGEQCLWSHVLCFSMFSCRGGGVSPTFSTPSWQAPLNPNGKRGVPDVAGPGDPTTGWVVYMSTTTAYTGFETETRCCCWS
jgi:hypothetical protein